MDDICHLGTDLIDHGCLGGNGRIDRTGAQVQRKAENKFMDVSKMNDLNPCPFCGSQPKRADCIGCGYVQIICPECSANITIAILRNQEDISKESAELIKRWNQRQ